MVVVMHWARKLTVGYFVGGYVLTYKKNIKKSMDLLVLPLHKYPEYQLDCCKLINDEWKRSETARLRSLESSSDNLPTCLILLNENKKVIGHCKLSPIPSVPDGCFVESVVIDKELRGKGYGTFLMTKAEEYCKCHLQLKIVYLSTKGQEEFYSKLGYTVCEPVPMFGMYVPRNKPTTGSITIIRKANGLNNVHSKTYMCKYIQ